MERTNANDFRANLKEWLETARKEPVKITRKSGEAFVLLNAEEFEGMKMELATLRGVARGLNDVVQGRTRKSTNETIDSAIGRAKERALSKRNKKAVGE